MSLLPNLIFTAPIGASIQKRWKAGFRHFFGFSFIEMMAVLAIVAILAAVAVPSFKGILVSTNMTTQSNDFKGVVAFTRSEAIKRNSRVTLCQSSNGTDCGVGGNWEQGYIVFEDKVNPIGEKMSISETLISSSAALAGGSTLRISTGQSYISFSQNGRSSIPLGAEWKLCPNPTETNKRGFIISVNALGVIIVTENTALPCG